MHRCDGRTAGVLSAPRGLLFPTEPCRKSNSRKIRSLAQTHTSGLLAYVVLFVLDFAHVLSCASAGLLEVDHGLHRALQPDEKRHKGLIR